MAESERKFSISVGGFWPPVCPFFPFSLPSNHKSHVDVASGVTGCWVLSSAGSTVGLDGLRGLFQHKQFHDSYSQMAQWHASANGGLAP